MSKRSERRFETVFIPSEKTIDLRTMVALIVEKINRGELNEYENAKREIRRTSSGDCKPDGHEEH
jgi:hypothetical protein